MDLGLTEEQRALVSSLAELLAVHSTSEVVRKSEDSGIDLPLWATLQEFGILRMAVPETSGGWGASFVDLCLVAEQLGATLAPVPAVETQVAARLLGRLAEQVAGTALGAALCGKRIVTIAVRPASGEIATLVPGAAVADQALVRRDDRLVLVDLDDSTRHGIANLASEPLADIDVADGAVVASGSEADQSFDRAIDEWLVLTAARLVGAAEAAHRMTCHYALERETWGKPIGSNQAVSHPLADSATAIDGARLLTRKAAWAADVADLRAAELAAMAFAFASETARDATYQAVHFHGGVGFTLEHDAQLYYRRVRGWARAWGAPLDAYRRVSAHRHNVSA
jgi:alkylation response protein AidB-like acyl-CoA dehydrogenase